MNDDFLVWLDNVQLYLPQLMSVAEARELYERKLEDDKKLKDEDIKTIGQHKQNPIIGIRWKESTQG